MRNIFIRALLILTLSGGIAHAQTQVDLAHQVKSVVPVANGGTGTTSPALVQGTNVTITGTWPNQTINSTGGGGMTYPGAGIALSTGSAWSTSLTAPSGAIVGTTDTQTLTNKSVNGVTLNAAGSSSLFLNQAGGYTTPAGGGGITCSTSGGIVYYNGSAYVCDTTFKTSGAGAVTAVSFTGTDTTVNGYFEADRATSGDVNPPTPAANGVTFSVSGGKALIKYADGSTSLIPNNAIWDCQPGLGDGFNAIPAHTYLQFTCINKTGKTIALNSISCIADGGSSTVSVTNGAGTALLTGAITCGTSYTAGTQSGTTTLVNADYLKFTIVADGTTKQVSVDVSGARAW